MKLKLDLTMHSNILVEKANEEAQRQLKEKDNVIAVLQAENAKKLMRLI